MGKTKQEHKLWLSGLAFWVKKPIGYLSGKTISFKRLSRGSFLFWFGFDPLRHLLKEFIAKLMAQSKTISFVVLARRCQDVQQIFVETPKKKQVRLVPGQTGRTTAGLLAGLFVCLLVGSFFSLCFSKPFQTLLINEGISYEDAVARFFFFFAKWMPFPADLFSERTCYYQ